MAKMNIKECAQALPCTHTKNCFNRDMMLTKDNTPRQADTGTQVILVTNKRRTLQWPAHSMDLNPCKHSWDILKRIVRVQPLQPNLKELTFVTHHMCHSTTVSSQIHYIIGNNVHYIHIGVFVFMVSMLTLYVKCVPMIKFQ